MKTIVYVGLAADRKKEPGHSAQGQKKAEQKQERFRSPLEEALKVIRGGSVSLPLEMSSRKSESHIFPMHTEAG